MEFEKIKKGHGEVQEYYKDKVGELKEMLNITDRNSRICNDTGNVVVSTLTTYLDIFPFSFCQHHYSILLPMYLYLLFVEISSHVNED